MRNPLLELADSTLKLPDNARVGVIGGGPAGSFFSYFLLEMAQQMGIDATVDIYEPRDYSKVGAAGCNMCGGIISESLVQQLAADGINLPNAVVERGIDSYVLHMKEGTTRITTPLNEKRIAAVHRGAGPRGMKESRWRSFDGHLLALAEKQGAKVTRARVENLAWHEGRPLVVVGGQPSEPYDLIAVATGVNSPFLRSLEKTNTAYRPPRTTRTYICEYLLGEAVVDECLGNAMHVFLLDIPRLEFAALIPKGDYVTLCLLGTNIDNELIRSLVDSDVVRNCLPKGWTPPPDHCHCGPQINIGRAENMFDDRIVFLGDAGVTRLYKDGIGAAYRTAKAAARTAVFKGVSGEDFRRGCGPVFDGIETDNSIGKLIFGVTRIQQHNVPSRRGILRMVSREQMSPDSPRRMSTIMWDMFTGSASYRNILFRGMHPSFLWGLAWHFIAANVVRSKHPMEAPPAPVAPPAATTMEQTDALSLL